MDNKLYKKAYESFATEDYSEALRLVKECRKKLRKKSYLYKNDSGLKQEDIDLRLFEGKIHQRLANIDKAENIFEELRNKTISRNELVKTRAVLSYHLGEISELRRDPTNQIEWLWRSKEEYEEAGDYEMVIDIMFDLADTEDFPAQSGLIEHYKEIIQLSKNISDKDTARLNAARARLEIGYLLRHGDPKVASRFLILAHKEFERLGQTSLKYRALIHLADLKSITNLSRAKEILSNTLAEIPEDNIFYCIYNLKLINYHLRDDEYEIANEYQNRLNEKLDNAGSSLYLANALLETGKSYLLLPNSKQSFEIAVELSNRAVNIYDTLDLKIGKAIGYLIEGIAEYMKMQNSADSSKLQLVPFLAKKLSDKSSYKVDTWVRQMIHYLANSDLESDEIVAKLRVSEDIPTMTQNAEILHLLGLYKLSNTEMETARSYLDISKSLYSKTGSHRGITKQIDKQLADVIE